MFARFGGEPSECVTTCVSTLLQVQRLLDNYNIDPKSIGRLEVGTESLVDKSKSSKTTLMRLFEASGNRDIEGATVVNACYGGTAAFFNSTAWVESSEWYVGCACATAPLFVVFFCTPHLRICHRLPASTRLCARRDGRYAIVVSADIAVYDKGVARPTGGVGAVAALIGPEAPLRLVPRTRTTHAVDVYDFYKPSMLSEYPMVDGKLSQSCYLKAVDDCYTGHMEKLVKSGAVHSGAFAHRKLPHAIPTVDTAYDYLLFHSPYNKLVQQSYKRMLYNDARRFLAAGLPLPARKSSKSLIFLVLRCQTTTRNAS